MFALLEELYDDLEGMFGYLKLSSKVVGKWVAYTLFPYPLMKAFYNECLKLEKKREREIKWYHKAIFGVLSSIGPYALYGPPLLHLMNCDYLTAFLLWIGGCGVTLGAASFVYERELKRIN